MFNFACGSGHVSLPPNGNIATSNFNVNVGVPQSPTVNMSQNPLSFLSVPPPNLLASQHVFPSTINTSASPAFFSSNMAVRPIQPFVNSSGTNVPDFKIFQNLPPNQGQSVNIYPNNMQNFGNAGFSASNGHAMYPGTFSQPGNTLNHNQNPNNDNRPQAQRFNPWSPPPSNISNFSGNAVQNCPKFQSSNRNNRWSDRSRNSSTSEVSQNGNISSKFNGSKPKASDINPWMKPPTSFAEISFNNYGNGASHVQSQPQTSGYNSKESSSWKVNSNSNFKFSNHHGKQHQSNWKSGNFSGMKNNQNSTSFQHFGNSFKNFHNNKFQGRKNNNFKVKEDNGPNKPYACDTCDRAFAAEQELKLHLSEHIKCNAGNCDFEAHPKIVALHKKMQHETGYAEAINKLKDAEEIAKWRAERKRRFPTAENIRKRKAEQAEKEARGEVIETKDFGKMKKPRLENRFNRRHNRTDRRKRQFNNTNVHFKNERLLSTPKATSNASLDSDSDSDEDSHIKIRQFPGLIYLKENPVVQKPKEVVINNPEEIDSGKPVQNELSSVADDNEEEKVFNSDDEDPVEIPVDKSSPVVDVFSAKEDSDDEPPCEIPSGKCIETVLLETKESDVHEINDDSDDEPPSELPSRKCIETELLESKESNTHEINDDSEGDSPIEMPVAKVPLNEISNSDDLISKDKPSGKHSRDNAARSNRKFDRNQNKYSNRQNVVDQTPVRKSTLLEKLLADDIRHERNIIMQCVRYIVKNNFFDD
ncbi:FMR1-interacting protein NUFIP1-like isoform X1 [Argiope bruennichi]|nr:FMR1-interacting protein NUFIP1-like isoform X1 [Argiope bruennichi]